MHRESWRIAQATSIGTSHIATDKPCQDYAAHALLATPSGSVLLIAVSDGAGSAARSGTGSRIAVENLIRIATEYFDAGHSISDLSREEVSNWIARIISLLSETATTEGSPLREYACTLLAAIVGDESAAYIQICDGAIVVSESDADGWSYVFWPQHGEFANSTNFIVSPDIDTLMEFEHGAGSVNEVAVFSDGIENLVLHNTTKTVHGPFFSNMFRSVRASERVGEDPELSSGLVHYLSSATICDRTDDDKSLVLATRLPRS